MLVATTQQGQINITIAVLFLFSVAVGPSMGVMLGNSSLFCCTEPAVECHNLGLDGFAIDHFAFPLHSVMSCFSFQAE